MVCVVWFLKVVPQEQVICCQGIVFVMLALLLYVNNVVYAMDSVIILTLN